MLANDGERVYADNLPVGEGKLYLAACLFVFLGLIVGRVDHRTIQYEEVGIGGWQSVALLSLSVVRRSPSS